MATAQMPYFNGPSTQPSHSHLVCGGCQTLLMYPQGAANVRCARCNHVTPAPSSVGGDTAQIVCNGCRVLLSYQRGAQSVQCARCHTITQVPVYGHLTCGGCSTVLMYPIGAHSVKCSACQHITPAGAAPRVGGNARAAGAGAGPSNPGTRGAPLVQTVVVENPCSLDEEGNEVPNIAVGVKQQS